MHSLIGADPHAYVGDSTTPDTVRTRALQEAISRARWAEPHADVVGQVQRVYLELEEDLEDRNGG